MMLVDSLCQNKACGKLRELIWYAGVQEIAVIIGSHRDAHIQAGDTFLTVINFTTTKRTEVIASFVDVWKLSALELVFIFVLAVAHNVTQI